MNVHLRQITKAKVSFVDSSVKSILCVSIRYGLFFVTHYSVVYYKSDISSLFDLMVASSVIMQRFSKYCWSHYGVFVYNSLRENRPLMTLVIWKESH